MYQFTKDCETGIEQIDKEHAYFFELCNEAVAAVEKSVEVDDKAKELIGRIKNYTETHFAHEEAYMEQVNDPGLSLQKAEHQAFYEHAKAIDENTLTKDEYLKTIDYIIHWLFHHIIGSDILIGTAATVVPENEEDGEEFAKGIVFSKKFKTGIALIDEEHRELFAIIGRAYQVAHDEVIVSDKYDAMMDILSELEEYTRKHFADEENYMEQIGYSGLQAQKVAHGVFVEKLVNIDVRQLAAMDENPEKYLNEILNYLLDWLGNHILKMDKLIK